MSLSSPPPTLRWEGDVNGSLLLLDQTRLPREVVEIACRDVDEVWQAIRRLAVRGAPAIGVAAAYGVCLSLQEAGDDRLTQRAAVDAACEHLATSRPTAVNLFWALDRMRRVADDATAEPDKPALASRLLTEAQAIHQEDRDMCSAIGRRGADALDDLPLGAGILTHCNAGALATGGDGTALSVIFELARREQRPHVWVDETRPLLQGARLTAWELTQRGVEATLICDSMAAVVMRERRVQAIVTGADRIAANGDVANKIGTYGVAALAQLHEVPFYVAAPSSTFDRELASGAEIPIEQRDAAEITHGFGSATAPHGVAVYNPAFDVTPAEMIQGIVTERGLISPVNQETVAETLA